MTEQPANPFHEKAIIITGASSGIGKALALQLAAQGAWLVLASRDAKRLQVVATDCEAQGGLAQVVATDVSVEAECKNLIQQTVAAYGKLDGLVNNAGLTMVANFADVNDLNMMQKIMAVNYYGSVYCTHYALPYLKKTKGLLVGVASLTGKTGVPTRTFYSASKHALAGFFDSLRIELMDTEVDVTMIYPGLVATEVRERALGADGQPLQKSYLSEKGIMRAETCAEIIIKAMTKRQREVVMTGRGKLSMWLKLIAPQVVDNIARKTIMGKDK